MSRSMILLISFLGSFLSSKGQEPKSDTSLLSLIKLDLGGQGIGGTYEPRLSNKITVALSAGVGGAYEIAEGALEVNYGRPTFYVSLTPRYFYNRQKRMNRGKDILLNSGNYIGARVKFVAANNGPYDFYNSGVLANLHWGLQRALSPRWTFNFHIGAGYASDIDFGFGTIYPAIDFAFSYVLFNLKK